MGKGMKDRNAMYKVVELTKGIDKGIKMGDHTTLTKIANILFADGTPRKKIAHLTGLTETEIKTLLNTDSD
jgi:DNA-binding transcriptional regulator LsrR (DeoR family)